MTNAPNMTPMTPRLKPLLAACALSLLISSGSAFAAPQPVDRVSVLVNDAAITQSELQQATEQLRSQNPSSPAEQLRKRAMEELIMLSLQEQEAKRMGLSVDNATLDHAMQALAKQNNASLSQLRKKVTSQGMSWTALRTSVRKQILLDRLRDREVMRRINISEQEISDYLEAQESTQSSPQYQLEHFVVPLPAQMNKTTKEHAEAAVTLLQESLSKQRSAQEIMALFRTRNIPLEGGELGWRKAQDLPDPMNKIVPNLKTGETSQPVVDGQGVHILRLVATRQAQSGTVEQSSARHILLKTNPLRNATQARQELETLRQEMRDGKSFAALASEHSEDYGSGVMGGDLGWFGSGAMVPAFESQLKLLAPGQISQPFQTPFGWHIIKLEGRRQAEASSTNLRQQAQSAIAESKRAKATHRWLQQLRDQAFLEYPGEQ